MKKGFRWEADKLYIGKHIVGRVAQNGEYYCGSVTLVRGWVWAETRRRDVRDAQHDTELLCVSLLQDYYCGVARLLAELGIEVPDVV